MKKITLLMLMVTCAVFFQSKKELIKHSVDLDFLKKVQEKTKAKNDFQAWDTYELIGLSKALKIVEDKQHTAIMKLFTSQFPLLLAAHKKFFETDSKDTKVELIIAIVRAEEDFKKLLTDEQNIFYLSYDNEVMVDEAFRIII